MYQSLRILCSPEISIHILKNYLLCKFVDMSCFLYIISVDFHRKSKVQFFLFPTFRYANCSDQLKPQLCNLIALNETEVQETSGKKKINVCIAAAPWIPERIEKKKSLLPQAWNGSKEFRKWPQKGHLFRDTIHQRELLTSAEAQNLRKKKIR